MVFRRFTQHFSAKAKTVIAVDFTPSFLAVNCCKNGSRGNVTFLDADVTELIRPANWLVLVLRVRSFLLFLHFRSFLLVS